MITKEQQAEFLIEAMPYIKKYQDKILVIKYGGNAMLNDELKNSVMRDLTMLRMVGINVVLVHGGGPEINALLKKVGKESKFIDGLRYTDEETVEYVEMALAGKVNKSLVNLLQQNDAKAIGLCGIDGHMLLCEKQDERLGFVGKFEKVLFCAVGRGQRFDNFDRLVLKSFQKFCLERLGKICDLGYLFPLHQPPPKLARAKFFFARFLYESAQLCQGEILQNPFHFSFLFILQK